MLENREMKIKEFYADLNNKEYEEERIIEEEEFHPWKENSYSGRCT